MSELKITVVGSEKIIERFEKASLAVKNELRRNLQMAGALVMGSAKKNFKPRGGKGSKNTFRGAKTLRVQTGQLRRSITVNTSGTGLSTVVTVGPKVRYGAIHEFGGKTSAHIIEPRRKKVLRFVQKGKVRFAKRVHHPGSVIPARPYMQPALKENEKKIVNIIGRAFRALI